MRARDAIAFALASLAFSRVRTLLMLLAMSGEEIPEELRGAMPVFTLDVDASYSDFDAAPAIERPAGAQIIPLDSLDEESINLIS